nr:DEAD/DEAH box helicase [Tessaracoccus coleopterorum]
MSNQKYHDLVERYGPDRVGLLTGDSSVNPEAQIVVMTTEVLRNMIYAGSPTLSNLGYVVMDEVHYLADRFRARCGRRSSSRSRSRCRSSRCRPP